MSQTGRTMPLGDGRALGFAEYGDPQGIPVFYCHGFPGSRLEAAFAAEDALHLGLRVVAADRPGFGLSDPQPRRRISDWPADVAALADHLGIARFALLGVSGGAPYALACAALLPRRVSAVAVVAGLGPASRPDSTAAMPPLNRLFLALFRHAAPLGALLYHPLVRWLRRRPERMLDLFAASASAADRKVLGDSRCRRLLIASYRESFRRGVEGGCRELFLFSRPWAVPLEEIAAPVRLWHGEEDTIVPAALFHALAQSIPRAEALLLPGEGHFSLPIRRMKDILSFLARSAEDETDMQEDR